MQIDRQGKWAGLSVDICRAVAAVILRDASKVKYVSLAAAQRFPALQAGEIDLLVSNSTCTLARDAGQEVEFTGIYYYDGQGFLVRRSGAKVIKEVIKDLNRANICFQSATTTEANLADYFRGQKMRFTSFAFDRAEEAKATFPADRCEALTDDISALHAAFAGNARHAKATSSLARPSPRSPSARPCARATINLPTSCAGRCSP